MKKSTFILIFVAVMSLFAAIPVMGQSDKTASASSKDDVLTYVEEMPSFPGGDIALLNFISQNCKYPLNAQINGIHGKVVVSFIVERDGTISDVKIARSVESSLDYEAKKVVMAMPKWNPGKQNGIPVRVRHQVPVVFKIDSDIDNNTSQVTDPVATVVDIDSIHETNNLASIADKDEPFTVVERMPSFPGGDAALVAFLRENVHYPTFAVMQGIQGRVVVSFVVECDGSISEVKVIRSVCRQLDEEAMRVVMAMPKWIPGMQSGRLVRVIWQVPVRFSLR